MVDGGKSIGIELPSGLSDAQLAGRAALPQALPLSARLRAVFVHRTVQLPEATRAALLVAAAADADALATILRATALLELPDDALDLAEEAGLVSSDGVSVSFRHPLVRSAAYESAPVGRRQRTHAALAASRPKGIAIGRYGTAR